MTEDFVVRVDGVSKRFCRNLRRSMWYGVRDILRDVVGLRSANGTLRVDEFWALDNVNFELRRGECLGLVGANGAGKSTLLKLLNGIIRPDLGTIHMRGRVVALIEIGAGFHPMLTGRENVYINGAILGLTTAEIRRQFDDIVAFAELAEFIDTPVKFYSSGMYVRLGFAVAAHLRPDILLVDEVLAVGDMAFQAKCLQHVSRLCESGCTVILVSHNEELVRRVCTRGLLLERGTLVLSGGIHDCFAEYRRRPSGWIREVLRAGNGRVTITDVEFLDGEGRSTARFRLGDELRVRIHLVPREAVDSPVVELGFNSAHGVVAASARTGTPSGEGGYAGYQLGRIEKPTIVEVRFPSVSLAPGVYRITALVCGSDMLDIYDWRRNNWEIEVESDRYIRGMVHMPYEMRVIRPDSGA